MPSAYTLTDEALFALLACSEADMRLLLACFEQLAFNAPDTTWFSGRDDRGRVIQLHRVGSFAVLFIAPTAHRTLHVIDIRQI